MKLSPRPTPLPRRATLRPLAAALGLALLTLSSAGQAGPAVSHWTLTDPGTLGGTYSGG